ncbi:hypothetical protein D9758_010134 [Tetrapyrgos nigripes]|uniref:3-keto sterol reductase n=1 Tax=Tetrapyrgos nigripes TaxID=182062 RepID=A0A8H5CRX5_9AGAR|nr:hypothetical protein D9758_010134 [Tetrapyrgos nigripes]
MQRPIVVVTGANGGVGYGICQRLLFQLAESTSPDISLPVTDSSNSYAGNSNEHDNDARRHADQFPMPCEGLTLIMACRSVKRAEAARLKLLMSFNAHVEKLKKKKGYNGHGEKFRENVQVDIHSVDLAMTSTIQPFVYTLRTNYPYISHLVFNAGVAPFDGLDWVKLFKQASNDLMGVITAPKFYKQTWGERSLDGYGWVWQCNVFGHYCLYKALTPMLKSQRYPFDTRVIWTSSLEARKTYDSDDWQLKETRDPYGSSKYQTELIASHLDRLSLKTTSPSGKRLRHFVAHPGVCSTEIFDLHPILRYLKVWVFYIGRLFGSPNHTISWENGAVSVVWLSLISLATLSGLVGSSQIDGPVKFAAQTDFWGNPRVGIAEIADWEENQIEAARLVERCDALYKEIEQERGRIVESETATERM